MSRCCPVSIPARASKSRTPKPPQTASPKSLNRRAPRLERGLQAELGRAASWPNLSAMRVLSCRLEHLRFHREDGRTGGSARREFLGVETPHDARRLRRLCTTTDGANNKKPRGPP